MRSVTKRKAEATLRAVQRAYTSWVDEGHGPELNMEFDWSGEPTPTIVWEGGPYDWAIFASFGGVDEEFGFELPAVQFPDGVYGEPYAGWALSLFRTE